MDKEAGIIPDIIAAVPAQIAKVIYPSGVSADLGKELTPTQVTKGQTVVEYLSSGPPEDGGAHRYIFLIYKQTEQIVDDKFVPYNSTEGCLNVKTREYAAKYKLGNPVAGNYYTAQYDDYVPTLHAQFEKN